MLNYKKLEKNETIKIGDYTITNVRNYPTNFTLEIKGPGLKEDAYYLQNFRNYRLQFSGTIDGEWDYGSSSVENGFARAIAREVMWDGNGEVRSFAISKTLMLHIYLAIYATGITELSSLLLSDEFLSILYYEILKDVNGGKDLIVVDECTLKFG